jgi:hypothetical protein
MSATITTQQNRRVPLATGLAIAGAITAAAALGVTWEQSHDSSAPVETPALRTATAQDYLLYNYYHGPHVGLAEQQGTSKALAGEVPNAQVAEQQLLSKAPTSVVPNATVAEQQQQMFWTPTRQSRVQLGF